MAYRKLTKEGENFISYICDTQGNNLLQGNNGPLSFTDPVINKTWYANTSYDRDGVLIPINNANDLKSAFIYLFNKYSEIYKLDANIIAAQAYAESNFKIWNYAPNPSTASGISQFIMPSLYGVVIKNSLPVSPKFTENEINKLTIGLTNPSDENSYRVKYRVAKENRPILHQNVIDNLEIMIKAQCFYMRHIATRCKELASTSLFCYNRGTFFKDTYTESIDFCRNHKISKKNPRYYEEGVDYVWKIFAILCDENNQALGRKVKPSGYYFGYGPTNPNPEIQLDVTQFPNKNFNRYKANVDESEVKYPERSG